MRLIYCGKCGRSSPVKHKQFDGTYLCDKNKESYRVECIISIESPDKNGDIILADGLIIKPCRKKVGNSFSYRDPDSIFQSKQVPVRYKFLRSSNAYIANANIRRRDGKVWIATFTVNSASEYPKEFVENLYPAVGGKVKVRNEENPHIIEEFQLEEIGLIHTPNFHPDIPKCKIIEIKQYEVKSKQL